MATLNINKEPIFKKIKDLRPGHIGKNKAMIVLRLAENKAVVLSEYLEGRWKSVTFTAQSANNFSMDYEDLGPLKIV